MLEAKAIEALIRSVQKSLCTFSSIHAALADYRPMRMPIYTARQMVVWKEIPSEFLSGVSCELGYPRSVC